MDEWPILHQVVCGMCLHVICMYNSDALMVDVR